MAAARRAGRGLYTSFSRVYIGVYRRPATTGRFNQTQAQPVQRGRVRLVARSAIETDAGCRHHRRCREYFVSAAIEKYETKK